MGRYRNHTYPENAVQKQTIPREPFPVGLFLSWCLLTINDTPVLPAATRQADEYRVVADGSITIQPHARYCKSVAIAEYSPDLESGNRSKIWVLERTIGRKWINWSQDNCFWPQSAPALTLDFNTLGPKMQVLPSMLHHIRLSTNETRKECR